MLFNTKLLVLNSKKVMEDNRHTIIIGVENEIVIIKKVGVQHDLLNNTTCYKCSALKQAIIKTEL